MSVFDEEDGQTVRALGLTMAGFLLLTVVLISLALIIT
jgi:hypothetical protein